MTSVRRLLETTVASADTMHDFGIALASKLAAGDLVVLTGPLGAGKTTLSRGIGEGLQAIGTVSSPTFVVARTHRLKGQDTALVHVDAYRLGSPAELDDLDIDFASSIVLVEWGKGMTDGLTESWLEVEIERDHTGESEVRELRVTGFGPRWADIEIDF